jgi:hypothetical protein
MIYLLNMVIFNGYVKLPEGIVNTNISSPELISKYSNSILPTEVECHHHGKFDFSSTRMN